MLISILLALFFMHVLLVVGYSIDEEFNTSLDSDDSNKVLIIIQVRTRMTGIKF